MVLIKGCLVQLVLLCVVTALDQCYNGDGSAKDGWTIETCESGWCLTFDKSQAEQDHRECDKADICVSYGAKCGPPSIVINNQTISFPGGELCCCQGNLCNTSTPLSNAMTTTLYCFIIVVWLNSQ